MELDSRRCVRRRLNPSGLFFIGFALFLVGLAFKLALAPFHTWVPDVYEGSPLAITGFMAVAVKAAAFAVLARIVYVVVGHDSIALVPLWTIAILSMLVGNLGAIRQRNLKRLLRLLEHRASRLSCRRFRGRQSRAGSTHCCFTSWHTP